MVMTFVVPAYRNNYTIEYGTHTPRAVQSPENVISLMVVFRQLQHNKVLVMARLN
jgi:hypothetical protein